ncbi:hypothetical protein ACJX0J_035948 [Zea mays]
MRRARPMRFRQKVTRFEYHLLPSPSVIFILYLLYKIHLNITFLFQEAILLHTRARPMSYQLMCAYEFIYESTDVECSPFYAQVAMFLHVQILQGSIIATDGTPISSLLCTF